jgi:hypothetical protein
MCEQLPTINVVEHNVKLCVVLESVVQVHDKGDLGWQRSFEREGGLARSLRARNVEKGAGAHTSRMAPRMCRSARVCSVVLAWCCSGRREMYVSHSLAEESATQEFGVCCIKILPQSTPFSAPSWHKGDQRRGPIFFVLTKP